MAEKDRVQLYHEKAMEEMRRSVARIREMQKQSSWPHYFSFPPRLQLELTSRCNMRCRHCYNNSGVPQPTKDRMTPEEWRRFARYLADRGGVAQCVLSGGEPLLMGDTVFDIMDILRENDTTFLVFTNGYLLDRDRVRRFAEYRYQWFQISIDGAEASVHDPFRQCPGSWERAVRGAGMIAEAGLPLQIAHTVTSENLSGLRAMCELACRTGAGTLLLGEVNLSGRASEHRSLLLSREQKNQYLQAYEELTEEYAGRLTLLLTGPVKIHLMSLAGKPMDYAVIRPNGDIRLDCLAPFVIGNVLDEDLATVWRKKAPDCWQDERVTDYIAGFSDETDQNEAFGNYTDQDIRL